MNHMVSKFGTARTTEGHIQLIFGPMFSGKTTEMLRRINRYRLANRVCRVVKYRADTRYDEDKVATHDLHMHDAVGALKISEVWNDLLSAQVIGIDEGQFFDDVVECTENLANLGKIVIVAALDGDFNRKRFKNNILDLCPLSESVTKLTAVCTKCGEDAAFTFRLTSNLNQEVIGGQEMYTALCRNCYLEASKSLSRRESGLQSNVSAHGRIELILGPMFSGKTTELLRRRNRHALAGRECRVVKYSDGHRIHPNKVITHDELVHEAITAKRIEDIFDELLKCEVVLIDDGQFFPDAVEFSERLANCGKIVVVSALDGDYNRKMFYGDKMHKLGRLSEGNSLFMTKSTCFYEEGKALCEAFPNKLLDLCPLAEMISKLCAVCAYCDNDAAFSKRIADDCKCDTLHDKKKMYRATCRTCYMQGPKQQLPKVQNDRSPLKGSNIDRKRVQLEENDIESAKKLRGKDDSVINIALRA